MAEFLERLQDDGYKLVFDHGHVGRVHAAGLEVRAPQADRVRAVVGVDRGDDDLHAGRSLVHAADDFESVQAEEPNQVQRGKDESGLLVFQSQGPGGQVVVDGLGPAVLPESRQVDRAVERGGDDGLCIANGESHDSLPFLPVRPWRIPRMEFGAIRLVLSSSLSARP